MVRVTAQSLETGVVFAEGSEVVRVEYALGNLRAFVRDISTEAELVVNFPDVICFRVLDERDLMEFWPECSTPNGWLFEIKTGGWLSQEANRPGSCLVAMSPNAKEYFLNGADDCVSVISHTLPEVHRNAL